MESREIIHEKVYASPRLPPKISYQDNWMKELDSEIAGGNVDSQQIKNPEPNYQEQEDPWVDTTKGIEEDILFGLEDIKLSTRTGRLVGGLKSIQSCVSTPVIIKEKHQTRPEIPEGGQESTKAEELDIDFRVPGLSHAVVKAAEHFRVQELVKKIESHPRWEALQADLQQKNVYNPFSKNSKAMIFELGNE